MKFTKSQKQQLLHIIADKTEGFYSSEYEEEALKEIEQVFNSTYPWFPPPPPKPQFVFKVGDILQIMVQNNDQIIRTSVKMEKDGEVPKALTQLIGTKR